MESYFMTDEYVERRRAYVNEIRRSFDRPEVENGTAEEESQPLVPWIFLKIRIVLAVLLMLAFLLLNIMHMNSMAIRQKMSLTLFLIISIIQFCRIML